MMLGADRKAELAQKKARLAALREERLKKEEQQFKISSTVSLPSLDSVSVDGILKELGVADNLEINGKIDSNGLDNLINSKALSSNANFVNRQPANLSASKIFQCSVDAQGLITYSKHVQTDQEKLSGVNSPSIERWNDETSRTFSALQSFEWDNEIGANPYDENDSELPGVTQLLHLLELDKSVRFNRPEPPAKSVPPRDLTEDEKQDTMKTTSFQDFFLRASRVVQRALDEPNDIFFDYSGTERKEDAQGKHQLVKYIGEFYDKAYVPIGGQSAVVALDWSAVHPELLLAAYQTSKDSDGFAECNGDNGESSCCCIWNIKYRQTALQSIFTYQVDITAAALTEFHPSMVIGGTRGGQIVLWDSRVNRRTPVQMTHLAGSGGGAAHSEAICSLAVTGSRNANSLVSVSSEGRLCAWSLDMLGAPIQTLDLTPSASSAMGLKRSSNPITPTCLAFLPGLDPCRFLVGAQDGSVYSGTRNEKNAGLTTQFEGHRAPVTGVSVLAGAEAPGIEEGASGGAIPVGGGGGPLFVTTGMDCSMRLWSIRESPSHPILTYEDRNDYFVGCDASPIHPALFATTDLTGCLDLWSLNSDHEVPTASIQVEGDTLLNQCRFHKKGSHLAVGGDDGRVRLFEIHENLAIPKQEEWSQLNRMVRNLANTAAEEHDVQNNSRRQRS